MQLRLVVRPVSILAVTVFAAAMMMARCVNHPVPAQSFTTELHSANSIARYDIFDLSLKHNGVYDNNFFDVVLDVAFTSPDGTQHRVKGFYYGGDLWKARFRPDEPGAWTYTYTLTGKGGFRQEGERN